MKIWKLHWKLRSKNKGQHCFANISTMKARVFLKFYFVINYYLVSISCTFHEDPCTNARAQVLNRCTRDKTCAQAFTARSGAIMHRSSWNLKLMRKYLQNNTGICWILNFQCILHISYIWASKFFFQILLIFFLMHILKCKPFIEIFPQIWAPMVLSVLSTLEMPFFLKDPVVLVK